MLHSLDTTHVEDAYPSKLLLHIHKMGMVVMSFQTSLTGHEFPKISPVLIFPYTD